MEHFQTKIAKVTGAEDEIFAEAGAIIRGGGLVAFPTETVYGLGANGLDAFAASKIYEAKGRPSDNPLILHVADRAMINIAAEITEDAKRVMDEFFPGPVTVILPKRKAVPESVTGGLGTVGVRMPANDIALALIRAAGVPIAAPSANISGRPSPTTAEMVMRDLSGRAPLILDGGPCRFGVESTIIDCSRRPAEILRPGAVTREMLEKILGEVALDPALIKKDEAPRAPGMKYTHYAPRAPLTLIVSERESLAGLFRRAVEREREKGNTPGLIISRELSSEISDLVPKNLVTIYGSRDDLQEVAAGLYASLRYFDNGSAEVLFAEGVGEDGIGLAVMNRLTKASGGRTIKNEDFL